MSQQNIDWPHHMQAYAASVAQGLCRELNQKLKQRHKQFEEKCAA